MKKPVENRILMKSSMERNLVKTLKEIISEELIKIKEETKAIVNLLKSNPVRLVTFGKSPVVVQIWN